jgi:L-malate glycosyltransferase
LTGVLRRPASSYVADPGSVTAVHQFLPALMPGDASGLHALNAQVALRAAGFQSEIFCEAVHHQLEGRGLIFHDFPSYAKGSILLYHLSTGSVLADFVNARPEPLVIDYHNLTPATFYRRWDMAVANAVNWGRSQLAMLVPRTALALADSSYNELELIEAEYRRTAVVPILLDIDAGSHEVDAAALDRLQEEKSAGGADILFVGRLAPNKAQQDLVKVLAVYRRVYDPRARLRLVGRPSTDSYLDALTGFVDELGLSEAVTIDTDTSDAQKAAYYEAADVYLCLSEHEGFNIPVLEAMRHRVPVIAYGSCAVPETVGDGGLLLEDKSASSAAAAVHIVLSDPSRRRDLVDAGQGRLAQFDLDASKKLLVNHLSFLTGVSV